MCKASGVKVKNITVRHLVVDTLAEFVGDMDYYICMNEECNIVYYNPESGVKFEKQQVKVPIWFKKMPILNTPVTAARLQRNR